MAVKRQQAALRRRLGDCEALLAALALAHGGSLTVKGGYLDYVAHETGTRTLSLKILVSGDMRVDFLPEAVCSST